jgi:hypothetical protein
MRQNDLNGLAIFLGLILVKDDKDNGSEKSARKNES